MSGNEQWFNKSEANNKRKPSSNKAPSSSKQKKKQLNKESNATPQSVNNKKANPISKKQKERIEAMEDPKLHEFRLKQQKKTKKKQLLISIGSLIVVAIGITVFIAVKYHLFAYIAEKPQFAFITNGTVEHTVGARAMIVRDEIVINSSSSGDLVAQVAEGSRVASGQSIAMVVPDNLTSVVTDLRNTRSMISEVQQELIRSGNSQGTEVIFGSIDERIAPIVDMLRTDSMNGNTSSISSYSSSINVLISQRETQLSLVDFDDERLRVLRSDEDNYESRLQGGSALINATSPGIISFNLDGMEDTLSFDYLLSADSSEIINAITSSDSAISSDLIVDSGESIARIATNDEQYIAVYVDSSVVRESDFEVGTLHTLNISSEGVSISRCQVERVNMTTDGLLIVFSTTKYVEDLLGIRSADIEIVVSESSGYRVPSSAVVNPDYDRGIGSIYVNNQGFVEEVNVIISDYDREFAIITGMESENYPDLSTVYIINPESVRPGDEI